MAAPTIQRAYPSDGLLNVPLGASIEILFDVGVDLSTGKNNVVVYGPDFDKTSGPEGAVWLGEDGTAPNSRFLKSPGFTGVVECRYSVLYTDDTGAVLDPQPTVYNRYSESGYLQKLVVTPKSLLSPEVAYKVYIIGNSEGGLARGIASRTVFDVNLTSVTSDTGGLVAYGGYNRNNSDIVHIRVTEAGNIGSAKFMWWYESDGISGASRGHTISTRYRKLSDGIQIRFTGSGFVKDDEYTFAVEPPEYMETSYNLTFTTGTGSVINVPSEASASVIGVSVPAGGEGLVPLSIDSVDPPDGSTHQPLDTRTIEIEFSEDLDVETITDDTVTVLVYPVDGRYSSKEVKELSKKLTVEDNILMIDI